MVGAANPSAKCTVFGSTLKSYAGDTTVCVHPEAVSLPLLLPCHVAVPTSIVTANRSQNFDLFWAICGGTGGNFGVLLNVTYKLRPLGEVMGFSFTWPLASAADRVTAKGYGDSVPVEEPKGLKEPKLGAARAKNRRVEFKLISKLTQ